MRDRRCLAVAGFIATVALTGCVDVDSLEPVNDAPLTSQTPAATPATSVGTALSSLGGLDVKGRAPMTGYDRALYGQERLDTDRNGCDTRNDTLGRHLTRITSDPDTGGCVVLSGTLVDQYTGSRIEFVRGDGSLVDIDHVVALGNAWAGGAARWDIRKRAAFANDPLNLLPADAGANRAKGDGDAATWLPPNKLFRCAYVARQVAVKAKYGLPVTPAEGEAIGRILSSCPQEPLPPDSGAPVVTDVKVNAPTSRPQQSEQRPQGFKPNGAPVYFENCDAARAAGAAPVRRGEPGYGPHLDGDGDGSACE